LRGAGTLLLLLLLFFTPILNSLNPNHNQGKDVRDGGVRDGADVGEEGKRRVAGPGLATRSRRGGLRSFIGHVNLVIHRRSAGPSVSMMLAVAVPSSLYQLSILLSLSHTHSACIRQHLIDSGSLSLTDRSLACLHRPRRR